MNRHIPSFLFTDDTIPDRQSHPKRPRQRRLRKPRRQLDRSVFCLPNTVVHCSKSLVITCLSIYKDLVHGLYDVLTDNPLIEEEEEAEDENSPRDDDEAAGLSTAVCGPSSRVHRQYVARPRTPPAPLPLVSYTDPQSIPASKTMLCKPARMVGAYLSITVSVHSCASHPRRSHQTCPWLA